MGLQKKKKMTVLVFSTESTLSKTDFQDFMEGLRNMIRVLYDGMELPANDYATMNMFRYGGSDRAEDDEYRTRQGYVFYDITQQKKRCLCKHQISNLFYIVPKWDNKINDKLAVGSTCIKRFYVKNHCRNCHHEFRVQYDHCADLCQSCQTCRLCHKKKPATKNMCSACWKNIFVPQVDTIHHKKINEAKMRYEKQQEAINTFTRKRQINIVRRWIRRVVLRFVEKKRFQKQLLLFQRKRSMRLIQRHIVSIIKEKRRKTDIVRFIEKQKQLDILRKKKIVAECLLQFVLKLRKKRQLASSRQKRHHDKIKKLGMMTKNIGQWDKKPYPRHSHQTVKFWDLAYEVVYRMDRDNPYHCMPFKEYATLKSIL
jgi:hypothetical protein